MKEERKAGDYTIKHSMRIGASEVVLAENMDDVDGNYYLVANYECNEIFERYVNVCVSGDYVEIAEIFAQRISKEIDRLKQSRAGLNMNVITKDACLPIDNKTFVGEIIVIRPERICPEYRNEHYQIMRCTGGNGAKSDGLGTSVFCRELFTGEDVKYRRGDVMGVLKKECYPDWLKEKLKFEHNLQKKKKMKEEER